jgi:hypothetical protein
MRRQKVIAAWACILASLSTPVLYADDGTGHGDKKVRHVLVISIDGMHALDFALCVKNNTCPSIALLSAQGLNYTNASSTKPSDSIPSTSGIFTGGSPALTGMYYDDAYNRAWFASTNTTCTGTPGTTFSLKGDIDVDPQPVVPTATNETVDPNKSPRQLVNGVCTPVLPHNMIRVNTVFEVIRAAHGYTAYADKTASYDFLNGPSGTGIIDLYTPEIGTAILKDINLTEQFDDLRVSAILHEINGFDHTGKLAAPVPTIFGMNFQALNAAKKDSLGGGYADDMGTPNAALMGALQYTDTSIGKFVAALASQNLTNTTAIILMAKHGEAALDPSERVIDTTSSPNQIQNILNAAGLTQTVVPIPKITTKTAALIWLKDPSQAQAVASVMTLKANEQALHLQQILVGESLKLLFPDPTLDPAPPDIVLIPINGTNFEPTASTALPAVQAEHGGFNENETHVPLLVVHASLPRDQYRNAVTTTQIAPTILSLLGLDPNALQAVQLEGTVSLPGIPVKSNSGQGQE